MKLLPLITLSFCVLIFCQCGVKGPPKAPEGTGIPSYVLSHMEIPQEFILHNKILKQFKSLDSVKIQLMVELSSLLELRKMYFEWKEYFEKNPLKRFHPDVKTPLEEKKIEYIHLCKKTKSQMLKVHREWQQTIILYEKWMLLEKNTRKDDLRSFDIFALYFDHKYQLLLSELIYCLEFEPSEKSVIMKLFVPRSFYDSGFI